MKYFFTACILFVVLTVGVGLYFSGSPKEVRAERLDYARIADLADIQNTITWYYRNTKKLPENLEVLHQHIGTMTHVDPETKQSYEYRVLSDTKFQLCAQFLRMSNDTSEFNGNYYPYTAPVSESGILQGSNWQHEQGRVCFDREINLEYFKIQEGVSPVPMKVY